MAKVFSITIPRNEIVLDASRKGVASYSVTNISDQPQKGQAVARSRQANTQNWFSVKEPIREFPAGRSTEISVQINVPGGAAMGTYEFELDIVRDGAESLEDRTDQGQAATFAVTNRPAFPWWILAAGAAVVIVILAIFLIVKNLPPQVTPDKKTAVVPVLKGLTLEQATSLITNVGLIVGGTNQASSPDLPAGQVIVSNPPAGQSLPIGSPVALILSSGPGSAGGGSAGGSLERAPVEDTFTFAKSGAALCIPGCPDNTDPVLVLKNVQDGTQYISGLGLMRFDFGPEVPAGAKLIKANLELTVESFSSVSPTLELLVGAAAGSWNDGSAGFRCSNNYTSVKISQAGRLGVDLGPLLASDSANILKYGLCIVIKETGYVAFYSREDGTAANHPLLTIYHQP
jgi:hypothetical protein